MFSNAKRGLCVLKGYACVFEVEGNFHLSPRLTAAKVLKDNGLIMLLVHGIIYGVIFPRLASFS